MTWPSAENRPISASSRSPRRLNTRRSQCSAKTAGRPTATRCGKRSRKGSSSTCSSTTRTYSAYFKLLKAVEDDPEVERKKAARALARFLRLHPHNLAQKTEVMVEHFHRSHPAPNRRPC